MDAQTKFRKLFRRVDEIAMNAKSEGEYDDILDLIENDDRFAEAASKAEGRNDELVEILEQLGQLVRENPGVDFSY